MTYLGTTEFYLEVSKGNVAGHSVVRKFGRNDDVDTASEEDVWAGGGSRAYLSSAETMDVVSTSTNDDGSPAGTGARTIRVEGLDSSYAEVSEDITLDGTTSVTTTQTFLRISRAYVLTAGSVETNDGQISVDPTTSGSGSRQAFIDSGDGQTLISHFTIPASKTGYIVSTNGGVAAGSGAGAKEARLRMFIRELNGAWRLQKELDLNNAGTSSSPNFSFPIPASCPEKTDMKWTAVVDANNTSVYVQYAILLVDD